MNCDEYRQAVTADPSFEGGGEHLAGCSGCQAYRQELMAFDRKIERALSLRVPEISIPDLPDIETDNVTPAGAAFRRLRGSRWPRP